MIRKISLILFSLMYLWVSSVWAVSNISYEIDELEHSLSVDELKAPDVSIDELKQYPLPIDRLKEHSVSVDELESTDWVGVIIIAKMGCDVYLDTSPFDVNLSSADTNAQKAFETLDELVKVSSATYSVTSSTSDYSLDSDKLDGKHWSEIHEVIVDTATYSNISSTSTYALTSATATYSSDSDKLDGLHYDAFVSTTGDTMSGDLEVIGTGTFDTLTITAGIQEYTFSGIGPELSLQSQTAGTGNLFRFFSKDGDGTDGVSFALYGVGTPATPGDFENLVWGWDPNNNEYSIRTGKGFISGDAQPINIYTSGNRGQCVLNTDGSVDFGGNVDVAGTLETTGNIGAGRTPLVRLDVLTVNSNAVSITAGITNTAIRIHDPDTHVGPKWGISWLGQGAGDITIAAIEPSVVGGWDTHLDFYTRQGGTLTNALHLDENRNVGIGTTSPETLLHIAGSGTSRIRLSDTGAGTDTEVNAVIQYYKGLNTNKVGWAGFGSSSNNDYTIMNRITGGDIILMPTATGKVGIGTSNPLYSLDVDEMGNSAGALKLQPDVQGDIVAFGDTDIASGAVGKSITVWRKSADVYGDRYFLFRVNQWGQGNFFSTGDLILENAAASGKYIWLNSDSHMYFNLGAGDKHYYFRDSASDVVFDVDSDGNTLIDGVVGIGVTDPDTKLEIFNAGDQLKLSYDATNYFKFATQSDGDLTLDSNKAGYDLDFGDGNLITTGDVTTNGLILNDPTNNDDVTHEVSAHGSASGGTIGWTLFGSNEIWVNKWAGHIIGLDQDLRHNAGAGATFAYLTVTYDVHFKALELGDEAPTAGNWILDVAPATLGEASPGSDGIDGKGATFIFADGQDSRYAGTAGDGGNMEITLGSKGVGYQGAGDGIDGQLIIINLPTADPAIVGALWNDNWTIKISSGP